MIHLNQQKQKLNTKSFLKNFECHCKWWKNINNEIFKDSFGYHNPSFLVKDLFNASQAKNKKIVILAYNLLTNLRNDVIKKISLNWKPVK